MMHTVRLAAVSKHFGSGSQRVTAVDRVDLEVAAGAICVVAGRSGSGKTTLLNIVGGLERPDEGEVEVAGIRIWEGDEDLRAGVRRTKVSFIFQAFGLLPQLSAFENVEIPLRLQGVRGDERERMVTDLLDAVGLGGRARHRPGELSGGEQQRVAIARALATGPELIIADEPTGQLDSDTGAQIIDLLKRAAWERGMAMLIATHDPLITAQAGVLWKMSDGRLSPG
jgi:putative ABC transport system ATP-binding protein